MAFPRSGPASRAVALDLMLRTCMNSAEFQASNPKIWENIAKLVPGTTPQQCAQRWEELRAMSSSIVGDYSGLTAQGRPISSHSHSRRQMTKFVRSMLNSHPNSRNDGPPSGYPERPHSARVLSTERPRSMADSHPPQSGSGEKVHAQSGKFVASFCQTVLSGGRREEEERVGLGRQEHDGFHGNAQQNRTAVLESRREMPSVCEVNPSPNMDNSISIGSTREHRPHMVIHVCDEAKKLKRDFVCPRNVLVKEMRYFSEYFSSDAQLWDEVDISVHCDVPVFDWLMRYAKRGMWEGPCGEELPCPLSPPTLEAGNTVSILISSDFLKMDSLVEECLDFCHENISSVVASPCNMGCINDKLMARLAVRFTPMEVERFTDKKDKVKSKLFVHKLEEMFNPSYSTPDCPANAATLYKCKHCGRLLTREQQTMLPCTAKRLSVDRMGRVVYSHERDPGWDVNQLTHSLQQEGLTPRDIYWRLWGTVNWLVCERCKAPFQCVDLATCAFHSQAVSSRGAKLPTPQYLCCGQPAARFPTLPHWQNGCTYRDHTVSSCIAKASKQPNSASSSSFNGTSSERLHSTPARPHSERVYSTLLALRDTICGERPQRRRDLGAAGQGGTDVHHLLTNEERKPRIHPSPDPPHQHNRSDREATPSGVSENSSNPPSTKQSLAQGVSMATRQQSHDCSDLEEDEDDDEADNPPQLSVQPSKQRKGRQAHVRHRHSRSDLQGPVEWIWDSRKSKRLNQDMQRESDERRLAALSTQLLQMCPKTVPHSHSEGNIREAGMFSRLETQFRTQQTAKALALQTSVRGQGVGRRRYQ